ncbi:hypothetical protein VTH06DRAFT_6331 [Thermothelomyces fergusii]
MCSVEGGRLADISRIHGRMGTHLAKGPSECDANRLTTWSIPLSMFFQSLRGRSSGILRGSGQRGRMKRTSVQY